MKPRNLAVLTLACLLGACAPAGPRGPAPASLAYTLPATSPVSYTAADTGSFDLQVAKVEIASSARIELGFHPAGEKLRVTARFADFDGRFSNSMGGTIRADESDVQGEFVAEVDRRGRVEVVQMPELSDQFRAVAGSQNVMLDLFVRLPGRPIEPGVAWTDTIRGEETNEGLTSRRESLVTSTWSGDTVVAGQTLRVITSRESNTLTISGSSEGVELRQQLSGTSTARTLWDPARALLVERVAAGELKGTLDLPAMGMTGIPVQASVRERLELKHP